MRRPPVQQNKSQIQTRLPAELLERWLKMVTALGITESAALRIIVEAAVEVFEESEAEKCPQKPTPFKSTSTR